MDKSSFFDRYVKRDIECNKVTVVSACVCVCKALVYNLSTVARQLLNYSKLALRDSPPDNREIRCDICILHASLLQFDPEFHMDIER